MESNIIMLFITIIIITFALLSYYHILPKKDLIDTKEIQKSYFINFLNRIDIQNKYECAAFATAYVLRHFGEKVDGNSIYKSFPCKLFDGTISPKGIYKCFKSFNYSISFYKGNIDTLKKQISKGIPVIVFIKVYSNKRYLHYVPVIGYDENHFYLAESLKYMINCTETNYNRIIAISDFKVLWRTWIPFYKNTYYVVNK